MNRYRNEKHRSSLWIGLLVCVFGLMNTLSMNGQTDEVLKLKKSPRLWVDKETVYHLKDKLHTQYLKDQAQRIIEDADWLIDFPPIREKEAEMYMQGTRTIASHLQCLTSAWVLTHDKKYRKAAMKHLENLLNWNHVSCEARANTPPDADMFFCLTYGEHSADIGLMYDIFRPDMTKKEQKIFFDVIDKFYLKEALECLDHAPWWANKSWSNWNGVCSGGMGILALAFYNDRPECRKLIPFVEKSLAEYFKSYIQNGGGSHEGTGYWNYGMHYAMRYLLSWEKATGRKHPAFEIEELRTSLNFPLDFTEINFGDNDSWGPTGMFFMLADRLNNPNAALRAATYLKVTEKPADGKRDRFYRAATGDVLYAADYIPTDEKMKELKMTHQTRKEPVARVYKGLEWGALADDSAFPTMRLSARGGSSAISGHGHVDIMSFICMVNGERMIDIQTDGGYISTTFSGRGHEIYSRSAAAKSTMYVDGLPPMVNVTCKSTQVVKKDNLEGIRIDGSNVYMARWKKGFIGRLFLMVENRYWLVIDAASRHYIESRFHTFARPEIHDNTVVLTKGKEQMAMTFAAYGKGMLQESRGMPVTLDKQTYMLRWMSPTRNYETVPEESGFHVTAMNPGNEKLSVRIQKEEGGFAIQVSGRNGYQRIVRVTNDLFLR